MNAVSIATFYKVSPVKDAHKLRRDVERLAVKESLYGTFFSTYEGINTTLAGPRSGLEKLLEFLEDSYQLSGISPTWSESKDIPFKRLKVRIKDRLLPLEGNFQPLSKKSTHVEPNDWNDVIEDPNTLLIDIRNEYESRIGSFKGSLMTNTKNFTDLPRFIEKNRKIFKKKKIAMFCTGGIRCEIASSFFINEGIEGVCQLKGGILNYLAQINLADQLWKGECFVFDERVSVNRRLKKGEFQQCFGCRRPISLQDMESEEYKKGVSCPHCYDNSTKKDKERFAQRQKQIELANLRGMKHLGQSARKEKI
tara:strand:- start:32 stop:958 length:927 start_codon:yes stop_codon:yes gene_type:complete